MALSKDDIIRIASGFLQSIRHKHDVRQAYILGSWATGTILGGEVIRLLLVRENEK